MSEEWMALMSHMEKLRNSELDMHPKVISIQRKKLLIALKEIPDEPISEEDIQYVGQYIKRFGSDYFPLKATSSSWGDDAGAHKKVDEILKKHAKFELSKYLHQAKVIFLAYSGQIKSSAPGAAMQYILAHARQFQHPAAFIFHQHRNDGSGEPCGDGSGSSSAESPRLPDTKLFNRIQQLIDDLKTSYDEHAFQVLNTNATYFTLLMLRRIVKNREEFLNAFKKIDTHDSYVKICPFPLDNQVPACGFKSEECWLLEAGRLAVAAYLAPSDERTRRALRATCVLYLEWNGLQLPHLFFKVMNLYNTKAGQLIDLFLSLKSLREHAIDALVHFADTYYRMYKSTESGATHDWFPFCRLVHSSYELKLSAKENGQVCTVLAYLVNMKLGFNRSTIRKAHWVKPHYNARCVKIAEHFRKVIDSNIVENVLHE